MVIGLERPYAYMKLQWPNGLPLKVPETKEQDHQKEIRQAHKHGA
jgi:hypothetical protein